MHRSILQLILVPVLLAAAGCASVRDTSLDHRLPLSTVPVLKLARYKSVQTREGQDPALALAVAISGGGHRAANFAMGVLLALEGFTHDGNPVNLLNEIDYFSTVSGGGFTAGTYISSLYDYLAGKDRKEPYSLRKVLYADKRARLESLERDYQSTILESWVNIRCAGHLDSGDLMERKFDRYMLGADKREKNRSLVLGDVFVPAAGKAPVRLPYWIANATVYENGVRFPFTPDILADYHIQGYTHDLKNCELKGDPYTLPLAVAMKTSASFPVAIPATTFRCRPPDDKLNTFLHVLDGGLTDNLGVGTAFDLLKQDKAPRKVLLIIDAYAGVSKPYSASESSPTGAPVAYRIMKIGLDSEHTYLRSEVEKTARDAERDGHGKIEVVFLNFEDLKPDVEKRVQDTKEEIARLRKERADAMARRMRREIDVLLDRKDDELKEAEESYALYMDARAVATSLSITRGEQKLLLQAGAAVVERNREKLVKHLVGTEKSDRE